MSARARPARRPVKIMRLLLISIGILLVVGILLFRECASVEEPEIYYSTRQEMVANDAIGRGWVPSWLPASAHSINETHNLDSNEVWMKFELDPGELKGIAECEKDNATVLGNAHGPRFSGHSWWTKPKEGDWDGYLCRWRFHDRAKEARMVVSKSKGTAYYWEEH